MITIIDYGMGNLGSVFNMLRRINVKSEITDDITKIERADRIILPGVGAFDTAIQQIDRMGLRDILVQKARIEKIPFLGICLGMQLLMDHSEEGTLPGLGLIKGEVLHFRNNIQNEYKIPHMGWNNVEILSGFNINKGFEGETRFYFVHSYYVKAENPSQVAMRCNYGFVFDAAIQSANIVGVQFHPEKSHRFGMEFLQNFANL